MTKPELARLTPDAPVEEAVEIIMRDGGVIIEDLFDDELIDEVNRDLQPVLDGQQGGEGFFEGVQTRRAAALFKRTARMVDVALNPLYFGIAKSILAKPTTAWFGDERFEIVADMQIGVTQAIRIGPGQGAQPLHRDDAAFLWRHPDYGREARVQIMVALSDFTAANGGTLVIPGSHLWDDERNPNREEAVPTVMSKGSSLIWIGSVYHGGGQNETSDTFRTGLTMAYDLGNVRSEENHFLSLPLDTIRSLPVEIRTMLGWSTGHDYLGYVEVAGHMDNPAKLLESPHYTAMGVGLPDRF